VVLEVHREREFGGVERGEELAAIDARNVVFERPDEPQPVGRAHGLDVHDRRAVIGEILGGDRPDADPGEVGDLHALEGKGRAQRAGR
jgi:hypothetical protein